MQGHHDDGNRDDVYRLNADVSHPIPCEKQTLARDDEKYGENFVPRQVESESYLSGRDRRERGVGNEQLRALRSAVCAVGLSAHRIDVRGRDGVDGGELVVPVFVGRGGGYGNRFGSVRFIEGEGRCGHPAAVGRQTLSANDDVAPDDLFLGRGGGGDSGGGGDVGGDLLGAHGGLVYRVAGVAHDVGVLAGGGVGEGELVVTCGVGGRRGYGNQLCDVISVAEGNRCVGDRGAAGRERSGDGDVAPDELVSGGNLGGNGGGDGDEGDGYLGAHGGLVGRSAGVAHDVGVAAGDGVGEDEFVVACGVGGGCGYLKVFHGFRLVNGEALGCQPGAFGRERSANDDVAPDDLFLGRGGGGDSGRNGDVGDDHFGALRAGVGAITRRAHHVGMLAGGGVGEGKLVVACGVGGSGGYGNELYDIIGVVEGDGRFRDEGAVGRERSANDDVAPDDLFLGRGGGGDSGRNGDVGDDHFGALRAGVGAVTLIGDLIVRRAWRRLLDLERKAAAFTGGRRADACPESVDVAVQLNQGVCYPGAVGGELSCDGDVTPDDLLRRSSGGGDRRVH